MTTNKGIFGEGTNFEERYIRNRERLREVISSVRSCGMTIVLTSGTWDLSHLGHLRYLNAAKQFGDFLIVGVDSDEKVRARKGEHRPIVAQDERLEILTHVRHVDAVVVKGSSDGRHSLIEFIRPDVLVISETTEHTQETIAEMEPYCGEVRLLPAQAQTSTSARVRTLHVSGAAELAKRIKKLVEEYIHNV